MGTFSLRKAYGFVKDSTSLGLAKVNSDFKELDIAIVKATDHKECPPRERHVRKIFVATSIARPRADAAYCIRGLIGRLNKTRNWTVALKTLIVIHRALREGDPIFREELLSYSYGHVLQISKFKDDSSHLAWDCSAWVRTYALFLEERLECFRILRYDIEAEHLMKSSSGKGHSKTRSLGLQDLLEQLPALEKLLFRLVGCQPEGAAFGNYLIQYALALVLKESFKIYCAINDGIINLVDMYFEMSRHDATKALDIYKRAGELAGSLSHFYDVCKGLELARNFKFPVLKEPPPSFLTTMEEYIKEAPWVGSVSNKKLEYQERDTLSCKGEEGPPSESPKPASEDVKCPSLEPEKQWHANSEVAAQPIPTVDLLSFEDIAPVDVKLEESNALALAIISPADNSKSSVCGTDSSGWETALVTTGSDNNQLSGSKLAGETGINKLLLDSLYEDASKSHQIGEAYGVRPATNPFECEDPFAICTNIAPVDSQIGFMTQQQQQQYYYQQQQQPQQQQQQQQQQMMMIPFNYQPQYTYHNSSSTNPFGDPFSGLAQAASPQCNPSII